MITPWFIFTIFMLTLGPIKTVPAFFAMTEDQPPAAARVLALKGAAATAVSLVIALVMTGVAASWRVSPEDLRLAGGILLFAAARDIIGQFSPRASPPQPADPAQRQPAVTPLAIPIIVTPGVSPRFCFLPTSPSATRRCWRWSLAYCFWSCC